jgi:hypothetical protein
MICFNDSHCDGTWSSRPRDDRPALKVWARNSAHDRPHNAWVYAHVQGAGGTRADK